MTWTDQRLARLIERMQMFEPMIAEDVLRAFGIAGLRGRSVLDQLHYGHSRRHPRQDLAEGVHSHTCCYTYRVPSRSPFRQIAAAL